MAGILRDPEFDVVIVGAGVAGALIAWRLGLAGVSVALLEAGAGVVDRDVAVAAYGASASKSLGSPYSGGAAGPEHPGPMDTYYDQAGPEDFLSTYERIAGGSTWHWLGHAPRLLPNDFRLRSAYGVGVDWPIGYEDLEPWYCAAETALGVAGDDAEWADLHGAFRSRPFPMAPIWPSWSDVYVARRVDGMSVFGQPVRVLETPAARNSRPYDGRPPCAGNASCIPICPIGAKYDGSVHVKKALGTGMVKLVADAIATRLVLDRNGRIAAVEYLRGGQARSVGGRIVIVCAHAIESAKLLLMSAGPGAPDGVANSSGQVGRNLMDHMQKSVYVQTSDPVYPFRGPPSTAGIETFRDGPFRSERAAMRFSLNNDGFARSSKPSPRSEVAAAVEQGLFGQALRRQLFAAVSRQLRFSLSTELLPEPNNRITLSEKKDADGLPRPRISFNVGDYTRAAFAAALSVIEQLSQRLGAQIVEEDTSTKPGHYSGAGHIMGTCRMGADRHTAVVDANCRAFDHENLYIAGASLWPTCGTANPTLTVAAVSLRAADHIARTEFGRRLETFP